MVKYDWIPSSKNPYEKVSNLRKFFEVSTLQLINNPAINRIACRRFSSSEKSDYALLAWVQNGIYNTDSLKLFAEQIGIDAGILVGRLQHDGIIKYSQFNDLKTRYEFN